MATFNTSRLVSQVTLKGSLPDGRFTDQEILDLASDALISEIAPMLVASREEYYVYSKDYSITANQAAYAIPYRAMGATLREVKLVSGTEVKDLIRFDPEDVTQDTTGTTEGFYLQGNNIVLIPTPSATQYTLRVTYFLRPSSLVPVTECAVVTAVASSVVSITTPTGWTTANSFDIVSASSGYVVKGADLAASVVGASSITFSSTLPSDLAVGDYVTLAGESCFPHLPADAHQLLTQLTVMSCLESLGDQTNLVIAQQRAEGLRKSFAMLLSSRVQGAPRKFTSALI